MRIESFLRRQADGLPIAPPIESGLRPSAQVMDLYDPREQWASYLINAIKAKELQKRDINYIVKVRCPHVTPPAAGTYKRGSLPTLDGVLNEMRQLPCGASAPL